MLRCGLPLVLQAAEDVQMDKKTLHRSTSFLVAVAALYLSTGCGKSKPPAPKTYPVSIKITYHGQPVEGANVTLVPQDQSGRGASGTTDANGVARMGLPGLAEGVVPGKYWVTVAKVEGSQLVNATTPEEFYKQQQQASSGAPPSSPKHLLPTKYLTAQTSGLECVVKEQQGEQLFEFNLTD